MSGLPDYARADADLLRERLADADASGDGPGAVDAATATGMADAVRALEAVEWAHVPTVSAATAATFTGLLREACADHPSVDLAKPCPCCGSHRRAHTTLRPEPGRTIQVQECQVCAYPLHVGEEGGGSA